MYLGGGSKALVANSGVVWQNSAPRAGPSMVRRAWALGDGIFSKAGVAIGLVVMLGLLLSSRAFIKAVFNRLRRRALK